MKVRWCLLHLGHAVHGRASYRDRLRVHHVLQPNQEHGRQVGRRLNQGRRCHDRQHGHGPHERACCRVHNQHAHVCAFCLAPHRRFHR